MIFGITTKYEVLEAIAEASRESGGEGVGVDLLAETLRLSEIAATRHLERLWEQRLIEPGEPVERKPSPRFRTGGRFTQVPLDGKRARADSMVGTAGPMSPAAIADGGVRSRRAHEHRTHIRATPQNNQSSPGKIGSYREQRPLGQQQLRSAP